MSQTHIAINGTQWHLNGAITYPNTPAEGLLMNVRMVNATFEDRNRTDFDPDANTEMFIAKIPDYHAHGIRAFTFSLQGGMPGYEGAINSAINPDGSLHKSYMARITRVIHACDPHGIAVILSCFYQRQMHIFTDDNAIRNAVVNTVQWVTQNGFQNVVIEIANEYAHRGYVNHPLVKTNEGQIELINLAKKTAPNLIISTSGMGSGKLDETLIQACDFLILHFNNTDIADIPERINVLKKFSKPILCNEDTKVGPRGAETAALCVSHGCSWGLMQNRVNQTYPFSFDGANDDPAVYAQLKTLTTPKS